MMSSILRRRGGRRPLSRTGFLLFAASSLALSGCHSSRDLLDALAEPLEQAWNSLGGPKREAKPDSAATAQPNSTPANSTPANPVQAKSLSDQRLLAASAKPSEKTPAFVMADRDARADRREGAWQGGGVGPKDAMAAAEGYWVQIAARKERRLSERAWSRLVARHGQLLSAERYVIRRASFDDGRVFYRLQLGPYESRRNADSKCIALQAARIGCFLVASSGRIFLSKRALRAKAGQPKVRKAKVGSAKAGRTHASRANAGKAKVVRAKVIRARTVPQAKPAAATIRAVAPPPGPKPAVKRKPSNDPPFLKSTRIPGMPE